MKEQKISIPWTGVARRDSEGYEEAGDEEKLRHDFLGGGSVVFSDIVCFVRLEPGPKADLDFR